AEGPVRRLAVDDGGQVLDGGALDELALAELLLGFLARGHIEQQSLPGTEFAGFGLQEHRLFLEPDVGAVGATEAVLDRIRLMGAPGLEVEREDPVAIVWVEAVDPEVVG